MNTKNEIKQLKIKACKSILGYSLLAAIVFAGIAIKASLDAAPNEYSYTLTAVAVKNIAGGNANICIE